MVHKIRIMKIKSGPSLQLPSSFNVTEILLLQAEFQSALDNRNAKLFVDTVSLLVEAANHGAFPAPNVSPAQSSLKIMKTYAEQPSFLTIELMVNNIDVRAFQLVRHMCGKLKTQSLDIAALTLNSSTYRCESKPEIIDENEFAEYPARAIHLSFEVSRDPTNDRRLRRAVIDFRERITKTHIKRLNEWLRPWFLLMEAGAYYPPVGIASETTSTSGVVTLYDEFAAELCINRFQASECAWNGMLNMLDACWPETAIISLIEID